MKLYTDFTEGVYRLMDFNESHSQLLFRKHTLIPDEHFMDVLFTGTTHINMRNRLDGIQVSIVSKEKSQFSNDPEGTNFVFKIESSSGLVSYVAAAAFGIYYTKYSYPRTPHSMDTGLGRNGLSPEESKLIYWSKEDVDQWLNSKR